MLSVYVGENPRGKIRKLGIKNVKVSIYKIPKMRKQEQFIISLRKRGINQPEYFIITFKKKRN